MVGKKVGEWCWRGGVLRMGECMGCDNGYDDYCERNGLIIGCVVDIGS